MIAAIKAHFETLPFSFDDVFISKVATDFFPSTDLNSTPQNTA